MKLVYIYFDFKEKGYRGYKKCGFNFGTEYYFQMEENDGNKKLIGTLRKIGEKVETGFWGDERLYNISALVGDNGVGKSTIIHEMIQCLSGVGNQTRVVKPEYVILMQDSAKRNEREYLLYQSFEQPMEVCISDYTEVEISQINRNQIRNLIEKTKMIYFSNALTLSDKRQMDRMQSGSMQNLYTKPFYDCSLISDMVQAMKISGMRDGGLNQELDTYFNFRSYQEARYVFDRNQRKLLNMMKEQYHFPVPIPTELRLQIQAPSIMQSFCKGVPIYDVSVYDKYYGHVENLKAFYEAYQDYIRGCSAVGAMLAVLCLRCIESFMEYAEKGQSPFVFMIMTPWEFDKREFYCELLESIYQDSISSVEQEREELEVYKKDCLDYIHLLWNNYANIEKYFQKIERISNGHKMSYVQCQISLGKEIEDVLEEFMIRFINLTRAVSKEDYFVVYNWGLSSGESNLLHMFTKLRYLLQGCPYDMDTLTDLVTEVKREAVVKREEKLVNTDFEKEVVCDSVILFIDEADLTLHPEWQRQFIAILSAFLPKIFLNPYEGEEELGCRSIQVILGTHSPIMLGDFPAASAIYLHKNEADGIVVDDHGIKLTFGQNIYTVLKEGFYLQKGTIGEFARLKIAEVLKYLKELRENIEATEKGRSNEPLDTQGALSKLEIHERMTIQYLPDGIIKNKLREEMLFCERKLKENFGEEERLESQIEKLEQELTEKRKQLSQLKEGIVQ